jgi:ribonuclease P protein subunit RPR2
MSVVVPPTSVVPRQARRLVQVLGLVAFAAAIAAELVATGENDLVLIALCLALSAGGSFFQVPVPGGFWLQPHLGIVVFAALVVPPIPAAAIATVAILPGALRRHEAPYRMVANSATLVLCAAMTALVSNAIGGAHDVTGFICAALVFIVLNHALLGLVAELACGARLADALRVAAGLERTRGLALGLDGALALTGGSMASLWMAHPEALPLALGPAVLACAALSVPSLLHASQTDAKTGLFNYGHLRHLITAAIASASRTGEPVSVLMVDLDHLRVINNRHGHLTGDVLIGAVAHILRDCTVGRGSAGRFGGEEFCVVLPRTSAVAAAELADEIRARAATFHRSAGDGMPAMSVSIGVASYPEHGADVDGVLHAADMALYDAKLGGRNRVRLAPSNGSSPIPAPPVAEPAPPLPDPPLAADAEPRAGWVAPYVSILVAGAVALGLLAGTNRIEAEPVLFGALILSVLALDGLRIELFERLRTSPAGLPTIVLAAMFGPLGPIASELAIAAHRLARRNPPLRVAFDVGALSLAGGAAAATFTGLRQLGVDEVPACVAAGAAYYAVNLPLLATVIWLSSGTSPLRTLREQFAWLTPHYASYGALAGLFITVWETSGFSVFLVFGLPTAMLWVSERQYVARTRGNVADLRRSHAELEQANGELHRLLSDNQALLQRLHGDYLSTITALARTIEAKDPYTGGHTDRVARVALSLAAEMGFSADDLDAVETGASIHDIGKIGISDATLLKPGPLTPDERAEIERHPEISSYIVADLDVPSTVKQMVRSHHERYDGTGYPDGLAGEEIPLAARILSVADALDAMTSDRPYRPAMSTAAALAVISEHSGTQFCPDVVAALHCHLGSRPAASSRQEILT